MNKKEQLNEYLEQIASLEAQGERIREAISLVGEKIVNDFCPLKVGQDSVCKGYTHSGKKFRVDSLTFSRSWNNRVIVRGPIYKKDGTLSKSLKAEFRLDISEA